MTVAKIKFSPVDIEARKKLDFHSGDTIKVWSKIPEDKGKFRLQAFEGTILARKHGTEAGATFTVRRVASGVGVERIFPLFSPMIDRIEILKKSKSRKSKLYYVRTKAVRDVRRKLRSTTFQAEAEDSTEEVDNTEVAEKKEE
ncbi:MAG: 50S ribosomal protein L19 [Candidatus Pacebacteria bacterium]|nr:50S ribosomal protein L19 [Candidatus Paceibacterota bacterium]MCF7862452.1 50S ribosomal protein L19 [Candidatus Paceibacterota bacterium]